MKIKAVLTKKTIYLILVAGFLAIAALNLMSWIFLQGMKTELIQSMKTQIRHLCRTSSRVFNADDLEQILPGSENTQLTRYYQQLLYNIKIENNLENILLVDPMGQLLVDHRLNFRIGDTLFTFPLQKKLLNAAAIGEMPAPQLIRKEKQYFLTAYAPVLNDILEPVAVLVIDAPMTFFTTLDRFQTGTFYLGVGGISVLILFALTTLLATRRLFETEAQMREQERLVQLGQMAATVAHEIRNPLSIIKGSADVLKKKYADIPDEILAFIPEEIDRLNRLVESFLQFARQPRLAPEPISLRDAIRETLEPLADARIQVRLTDKLPPVLIDRDAFRQILLNLLRNAQEACTEKDKIFVEAEKPDNKSGKIFLHIRDNGKGIPTEEIARVFEPFYSSKATGSGLGMTISRQLIERMGGEIQLQSEPGKGTTISLLIPTA